MCALVQSTGLAAPATRSGHASASAIGNPHVRRARLGDRRSVGELHHRVNDRLAVHDDLDVIKS